MPKHMLNYPTTYAPMHGNLRCYKPFRIAKKHIKPYMSELGFSLNFGKKKQYDYFEVMIIFDTAEEVEKIG